MEDAVTTEEAQARWSALLDHLGRDRDEERHGAGVLVRMHGHPVVAKGCLLPDGTSTEAHCLAVPGGLPLKPQASTEARAATEVRAQLQHARAEADAAPADPADCVWRRRLPGRDPLIRRGRVLVEPGVALRFVDEPLAGEGADCALPGGPSLEYDLAASAEIARRIRSDVFAQLLYAALCNTEW